MSDVTLMTEAVTHQLYGALLAAARRTGVEPDAPLERRDRGAVSLEQVLWFAAAGISAAVIAGILWNRIFDEGRNSPITPPAAPTGGG